MNTALKTMLLMARSNNGTNSTPWQSYLTTTIAPPAWYSMTETSGTTDVNRGSLGTTINMTISNATLGQTGQLGVNNAFSWNGSNTLLSTANNATLAGYLIYEYILLLRPTSAGSSTTGAFCAWGSGSTGSEPHFRFNSALTSLDCRLFNTTPSTFTTTTTTGLTAATWALLFIAYDDTGDRKLHIRKGVSGAVTEYSYSAQPAMTGTYKVPTSQFCIGNRSSGTWAFDGLIDEMFVVNRNLSAGERTQLVALAGV